nr:MAG TPA: hypothetical protein [Caudoviricetes sp.]
MSVSNPHNRSVMNQIVRTHLVVISKFGMEQVANTDKR